MNGNLLSINRQATQEILPSVDTYSHYRYRSFWHPQAQAPPYKHVCQLGDPVLRRKAEEVDLTELRKSPARIMKIIANMRAVSLHYRAVGISAPQIGVPLRIIMIEFPEKNKKYFPAEVYAAREMATIPLKVPRRTVSSPEILVVRVLHQLPFFS